MVGRSGWRRAAGRRWLLVMGGLAPVMALAGCTPESRGPGWGFSQGQSSRIEAPEPEPAPPAPRTVWPPKAIWVVRHAWASPEQIAQLMERCQAAGFNTVLFQVRGNGTVFYRSRIEPLAEEYPRGDPGFDPLAVACREAHRRGMALHAWVNVMPAWKGTQPPRRRAEITQTPHLRSGLAYMGQSRAQEGGQDARPPEHLWYTHPEWFWYDRNGRRQPLGNWYVSLNPCLPEVRAYLTSLFEELVRNYPVDGLHLDYVRFPTDEGPRGVDYPHDARTLALYKSATGKTPAQDRAAWSRWRTAQVTQVVREIRAMTRRVRPELKLTAACWADIQAARRDYFQDGPAWVNAGLVDLVFVMNYTAKTSVYRQRQEAWRRAVAPRPVAAGVGAYMHRGQATTLEQVRAARAWGGGLAIFSDQVLFATSQAASEWAAVLRPALLSPQPK